MVKKRVSRSSKSVFNKDEPIRPVKDSSPMGKIFSGVFGILIGLTILTFLIGSWTIIGAGERGVLVKLGAVEDTILVPGFHFKEPLLEDVKHIDVQTQVIKFDNEKGAGDNTEQSSLFAASKDLQDVQIAVVVNYQQNPNKVNAIYQQYGESYQSNVLEPTVRETVKSISAKYTAEELVTKRQQFSDEIFKALSERFAEKDAIFQKFNVVNFEFSKSFSAAIEAKVTAEQNALAAKNKLEQVKYEAQQKVEAAKGEAEQIALINQQLEHSPAYIQYQAIQKWNGILPMITSGQAIPFINIPSSAGVPTPTNPPVTINGP